MSCRNSSGLYFNYIVFNMAAQQRQQFLNKVLSDSLFAATLTGIFLALRNRALNQTVNRLLLSIFGGWWPPSRALFLRIKDTNLSTRRLIIFEGLRSTFCALLLLTHFVRRWISKFWISGKVFRLGYVLLMLEEGCFWAASTRGVNICWEKN